MLVGFEARRFDRLARILKYSFSMGPTITQSCEDIFFVCLHELSPSMMYFELSGPPYCKVYQISSNTTICCHKSGCFFLLLLLSANLTDNIFVLLLVKEYFYFFHD